MLLPDSSQSDLVLSGTPTRSFRYLPAWVYKTMLMWSYSDVLQACRKHFLSGTATGEGSVGSCDPPARSVEKFFHLHFLVVWIGSHSTFVLCTALPRPYLAMGQGGQLPPRETGFRV